VIVVLSAGERRDLLAAIRYYEAEHSGRGERFAAAVERVRQRIATFTEIAPPLLRFEGYRRVRVVRFPHVVVYRVLPDRVRIVAIANTHRKPDYWRP